MKLLKPKKIPNKMIKVLYDTYTWGFDDAKQGLEKKSLEEVKTSLNRGFKQGINQRKD